MAGPVPSKDVVERSLGGAFTALTLLQSQGAQGAVFRAIAQDGSDVALKIYNVDHVEERSAREVAAMQKLKRSTIVRLHSAGRITIEKNSYRYIATPFITGQALSDRISAGPLEVTAAARVVMDLADAVDELWIHRIVHRDVKPPNVIVKPDGHAVLIDLGVARHLDQKTLTVAGYTFGTPGYFAPEHIGGRKLSCKADVFSAGIVFQEMLIGRHPTGERQDLLAAGGPRTSSIAHGVPSLIARLIDEMVAKRPYDRPTPSRIRAVLGGFLDQNAR